MRDEVGVSYFPLEKGWAFLTRVLHSSCNSPNSISDQRVFLLLVPFGREHMT